MKLRLRDNSIRMRLTRSEVQKAGAGGEVTATVPFPRGARLDYVLESSSAATVPSARLSGFALIVSVPESQLVRWANSDEVSIAAVQAIGDDQTLSILVEKDFACLAPREGEDESDMFAHPLEGQDTC